MAEAASQQTSNPRPPEPTTTEAVSQQTSNPREKICAYFGNCERIYAAESLRHAVIARTGHTLRNKHALYDAYLFATEAFSGRKERTNAWSFQKNGLFFSLGNGATWFERATGFDMGRRDLRGRGNSVWATEPGRLEGAARAAERGSGSGGWRGGALGRLE